MKETKRITALSLLLVLMSVLLLVGTTFAWFTDSASNIGNRIQAGTLDIKLEKKTADGYVEVTDGSTDPLFNYDKWEPGYSVSEVLKVSNNGNLALKYKLLLKNAKVEDSSLAEVIDVYAKISTSDIEAPDKFADVETAGYTKVGTLKDFLAEDNDGAAYGVLLPAGSTAKNADKEVVGTVYVGLVLHMQETAGNAYQGETVSNDGFNIVLDATQYTYEEDGFGDDQYDADANSYKLYFIVRGVSAEYINSSATLTINGVATTFNINEDSTCIEDNILPIEYKAGDEITLTFSNNNLRTVETYKFTGSKYNKNTDLVEKNTDVNTYTFIVPDHAANYVINCHNPAI